jgi:anaerobic selenocysteine-containing dehydrogenase
MEQAMANASPAKEVTLVTTCWECSTCCGALATVRAGRVVEFAPNRDHPYSQGAFCIKGTRGAPGITYGPNRLLYPLRRRGARGEGAFVRISWDRLAQLDDQPGSVWGLPRGQCARHGS